MVCNVVAIYGEEDQPNKSTPSSTNDWERKVEKLEEFPDWMLNRSNQADTQTSKFIITNKTLMDLADNWGNHPYSCNSVKDLLRIMAETQVQHISLVNISL